jgi:hypothetical protein
MSNQTGGGAGEVVGAGPHPRRRARGLPDRPHGRKRHRAGHAPAIQDRGACTRTSGPAGQSPRRRGRDPVAGRRQELDGLQRVSDGGRVRPGPNPAGRCVSAAPTEGGPMNTADGHELSWHEDDKLHQAEGMLAARLGISVDQAVDVIHRRAEASGLTPAEVAIQMLGEAPRPTN